VILKYSMGKLVLAKTVVGTISNSGRWHQDVKPENILVSTRGDELEFECEFKLADLGLSHFKIASDDAEDRDSRGTRTYGNYTSLCKLYSRITFCRSSGMLPKQCISSQKPLKSDAKSRHLVPRLRTK
jgi:serine/threonine protein kinase